MRLKFFRNTISNLKSENTLLKISLIVVMTFVVLCMCISLLIVKNQKTILLPPNIDKSVSIMSDTACEDYLRMQARYISSLFLCYSPSIVESNFKDLLKLISPENFCDFEVKLLKMKDTVKKLNASSIFYLEKIHIDFKKKHLHLTGLRKYKTAVDILENRNVTYRIDYQIDNGRFWVKNIQGAKLVD